MAHYFFDSSALVKRYVVETGSEWVRALCAPDIGNIIYISHITGVEIISAITRRLHMGDLYREDAQVVMQRFRSDFGQAYTIIEVTAEIIERAMNLAESIVLRSYDAVQLATALELQRARKEIALSPITFVCADRKLNEIAEVEGLLTDNPDMHL